MPDLRAEILEEIRQTLSVDLEVTEPVELCHELARDLGIDSMGAIILAVALEDRFRIKLSDEDAFAVVTVGDLVDLVERTSGKAPTTGDPEDAQREGTQ
ncbi:MAG TPA: acyl carrier protein [Thermoanaerobaculaceae bacterium]|nr:acyl carrier protein [Thermoanaerobaculaceae bacterium]